MWRISRRNGRTGDHTEHGNHHHAREEERGTDGGGVERVPRSRSNAFEAERPVRFIRLRGDVRRRGAWETGAGFVFISREEVTRRSERVHRVRGCVIRHREREESRNGCSRRETVRRVPESRGVVL